MRGNAPPKSIFGPLNKEHFAPEQHAAWDVEVRVVGVDRPLGHGDGDGGGTRGAVADRGPGRDGGEGGPVVRHGRGESAPE